MLNKKRIIALGLSLVMSLVVGCAGGNTKTDDAIVGDLFKSIEAQGFVTLSPFYAGTRNVYTKSKPVNTPEDLKGQKIRVMQSDTSIKMMGKMGGVATPMGQGEVYTAIQQGVLDGGENNELIYSDLKHAEVAKYYSYTKHLMMPDLLVINAALFNSMTPENQTIFKEEIKAASDYVNGYIIAVDGGWLAR